MPTFTQGLKYKHLELGTVVYADSISPAMAAVVTLDGKTLITPKSSLSPIIVFEAEAKEKITGIQSIKTPTGREFRVGEVATSQNYGTCKIGKMWNEYRIEITLPNGDVKETPISDLLKTSDAFPSLEEIIERCKENAEPDYSFTGNNILQALKEGKRVQFSRNHGELGWLNVCPVDKFSFEDLLECEWRLAPKIVTMKEITVYSSKSWIGNLYFGDKFMFSRQAENGFDIPITITYPWEE
jgi:hypothetical protein